jgi:hypothetical protein
MLLAPGVTLFQFGARLCVGFALARGFLACILARGRVLATLFYLCGDGCAVGVRIGDVETLFAGLAGRSRRPSLPQ